MVEVDGTVSNIIDIVEITLNETRSALTRKGVKGNTSSPGGYGGDLLGYKPYNSESVEPTPVELIDPKPLTTISSNEAIRAEMQQVLRRVNMLEQMAEITNKNMLRSYGNLNVQIGNNDASFHQAAERIDVTKQGQLGDAYPNGLLQPQYKSGGYSVLLETRSDTSEFVVRLPNTGARLPGVGPVAGLTIVYSTRSGFNATLHEAMSNPADLRIPVSYGQRVNGNYQVWVDITLTPDNGEAGVVIGFTNVIDTLLYNTRTQVKAFTQSDSKLIMFENLFNPNTLRYAEVTAGSFNDDMAGSASFTLPPDIEVVKVNGRIDIGTGFRASNCYKLRYIGHFNITRNWNNYLMFYNCISLTSSNCKVTMVDNVFTNDDIYVNSGIDGEVTAVDNYSGYYNLSNITGLTLPGGTATSIVSDMSFNLPMVKYIRGLVDLSRNSGGRIFEGSYNLEELPTIKAMSVNMNRMFYDCTRIERIDLTGVTCNAGTGRDAFKNCFYLRDLVNLDANIIPALDLTTCYSLETLRFTGTFNTAGQARINVSNTNMNRNGLVACWNTLPSTAGTFTINLSQEKLLSDNDRAVLTSKGWQLVVNK